MFVNVERKNYPERVGKNGLIIPAEYKCRYLHDGKEIAQYFSRRDVLYLRTDFIGGDFSKSAYERAITCKYAEAYQYLFAMLGVDETSTISEYMYG